MPNLPHYATTQKFTRNNLLDVDLNKADTNANSTGGLLHARLPLHLIEPSEYAKKDVQCILQRHHFGDWELSAHGDVVLPSDDEELPWNAAPIATKRAQFYSAAERITVRALCRFDPNLTTSTKCSVLSIVQLARPTWFASTFVMDHATSKKECLLS